MDLELSQEHRELRAATRSFITSVAPLRATRQRLDSRPARDAARWRRFAEQGWIGMLAPPELGGAGDDVDAVLALGVIVEEIGRELVPGPLVGVNVAAWALAGAPHSARLGSLTTGDGVLTAAHVVPGDPGLVAEPTADGGCTVSGSCVVQDLAHADAVVAAATRLGDPVLLVVELDGAGVSRSPLDGIDLLRSFDVLRLQDVRLAADRVIIPPEDRAVAAFDLAVALSCAEMVGALERTLEMTMEYARERKAFGRPIGSFQALKHRLTDMNVWLETGKALTFGALEAVATGVDPEEHASVAKAYLSRRGPAIVRDCLQIHGGIGFTWEHDLHLFLRRIESSAVLLGDVPWHEDRLFAIVDDRHRDEEVPA